MGFILTNYLLLGDYIMKIQKEHYDVLKDTILGVIATFESRGIHNPIQTHRDFLVREGKAKDIDMRLRWDFMHGAGIRIGESRNADIWEGKEYKTFLPLYDYLNDAHIDTALKSIFKNITV